MLFSEYSDIYYKKRSKTLEYFFRGAMTYYDSVYHFITTLEPLSKYFSYMPPFGSISAPCIIPSGILRLKWNSTSSFPDYDSILGRARQNNIDMTK